MTSLVFHTYPADIIYLHIKTVCQHDHFIINECLHIEAQVITVHWVIYTLLAFDSDGLHWPTQADGPVVIGEAPHLRETPVESSTPPTSLPTSH